MDIIKNISDTLNEQRGFLYLPYSLFASFVALLFDRVLTVFCPIDQDSFVSLLIIMSLFLWFLSFFGGIFHIKNIGIFVCNFCNLLLLFIGSCSS